MILLLLACALSALQGSVPAPPAAAAKPPPVLSRIAVIGASASAGFNACSTLGESLDLQIASSHEPPKSFADPALFLEPLRIGKAQVARASACKPSLVVAADFLFWFGYGVTGGEAQRLENLETGLALLDGLGCPLLVSRFPDMHAAVGKVLIAAQVPETDTLTKLNARVEAWASARGRVAFVPMPEFLDKLRTGAEFELGGLELGGPDAKRRFLQPDELHPTSEGIGALARLCLETACDPRIGAEARELRGELAAALATLRNLEAERARGSGPEKSKPALPKPGGVELEPATAPR